MNMKGKLAELLVAIIIVTSCPVKVCASDEKDSLNSMYVKGSELSAVLESSDDCFTSDSDVQLASDSYDELTEFNADSATETADASMESDVDNATESEDASMESDVDSATESEEASMESDADSATESEDVSTESDADSATESEDASMESDIDNATESEDASMESDADSATEVIQYVPHEEKEEDGFFASIFDFTMDPYGLVESTDAVRYGGGTVEPGATLLFHNRETGEYDFSGQSDRIILETDSISPVSITVTANIHAAKDETGDNLKTLEPSADDNSNDFDSESPKIVQAEKASWVWQIYLVDNQGHKVPILINQPGIISCELPVSTNGEESFYAFGLQGQCNPDANWDDVESQFILNVVWKIATIPLESSEDTLPSDESEEFPTSANHTSVDSVHDTESMPLVPLSNNTDYSHMDSLELQNHSGESETPEYTEYYTESINDEKLCQNTQLEATGLIDNTEAVEDVMPLDNMQPVEDAEPSGDTGPVEASEPSDVAKPVEKAGVSEDTQPVENTEPSDVVEPVENTELVKNAEPSDDTEPVENAEPSDDTEPIENAEPSDDTQSAEDTALSDVAKPIEGTAESL